MIHHGDLFDVLPTLAAESIDAVVTDPPYGLEFMGKDWDAPWKGSGIGGHSESGFKVVVMADGATRLPRPNYMGGTNPRCRNCGGDQRGSEKRKRKCRCDAPDFPNVLLPRMQAFQAWCESWGREVFRVLKPGGYIVSCGAPRAYHRMTSGLEDAGFEIRDCLAWLFGSGFPKSLNIGGGLGTALKPAHEPIVLARKPFKGTVRNNVVTHGTGALNIDATRIRPTSPDASRSRGDGSSDDTSPLLVASRTLHNASSQPEVWSEPAHAELASLLASALSRVLLTGSPQGSRVGCLPCSDCDGGRVHFAEAVGQASALRLLDARGLLDLRWIASRIRESQCDDHPSIWDALARRVEMEAASGNYTNGDVESLGRWPANVVLDDIASMVLDEQSGELVSGGTPYTRAGLGFSGNAYGQPEVAGNDGDSGGASRFYKVASADCILCTASRANHDTMSECETTPASTADRRSRITRLISDGIALSPAHVSLVEKIALAAPSAGSLCERCVTFTALALVEIKCLGSPRQGSSRFLDSIPRSRSSILTQHLASFAALWGSTDTIPTTQSLSMLFGSVCRAIESSTRPASLESVSDQLRFLYSAKPSREERDMGCYDLPAKTNCDISGRSEAGAGLNSPRAGALRTSGARNSHPTVKPVELMRWLVKLITPPGGTVLDPFTGSGTTGMACVYEQRQFIGIEREAEYIAIAERRIAAVAPLFSETA